MATTHFHFFPPPDDRVVSKFYSLTKHQIRYTSKRFSSPHKFEANLYDK
jgi:hypothetical protein